MDSLTHIALGACIGEAFFEKGFGKKAMWWGIMAQSIPDIDFIASLWMDTPSALLAHRGFTHSILFSLMIIPVFSLIAEKWHRPRNIRFVKWMYFFSAAIFFHIFIDAFNSYGVGWFEPFSHIRISFNSLYVADPFFSIIPVISASLLFIFNPYHTLRTILWKMGLIFPLFYLCFSLFNKFQVDDQIDRIYANKKKENLKVLTTPAPFQTWLWYVIVNTSEGSWTGYTSVWNKKLEMKFHPRNIALIHDIDDHESLQKLIRFSQDFYTLESENGTLVFNDLRFGQVMGWKKNNNPFVFHFDLNHEKNNELVIQKGRATGWNSNEWLDYYKVVFDLPLERLK